MDTTTTKTTEGVTSESLLLSRRIHGALALVLILLAAFLFAETIKSLKEYRFIGGGIAPSNAITVSGEGEVFAVPDTAEFSFTVLETAATSAEVQGAATTKANDAIKALVDLGIEEKDIKTVAYDLYPKYEWKTNTTCVRFPCEQNQVQVGFELNQTVQVKVRAIDRAGEMLEAVTGKGVSSVSGLTFTVADEDGIQADARKQAIDDARAKAEKLASDLGVSLVRIVGFSEGGDVPPVMFARDSAQSLGMGGAEEMMKSSVNVPTGENRVVSNVNITYEIR
ncbi:MAG: 26 kDa periplasmic immunogenic protein [Parcubacteria group bacterium GW2011_GWD2_42_14]|nr:MAG: 26 kDa periplasmic immunogenic protein [Parcubacteria group bacterium GW2011_GWD2_42_14]